MSLGLFPPPQPISMRTLRESNEVLLEGLEDYVVIDETVVYPSISFKPHEIIKPSVTKDSVEDIFITQETTLHKQFIRCFRTKGFAASLRLIRDYDNTESTNEKKWSIIILQQMADILLKTWTFIISVYVFFYPFAMKSNEELCEEFSKSMDWRNGVIRAFEWHPNVVKCAVCLINDSVKVFSAESNEILLRHPLQTKVTGLSWNPIKEDVLAVSCVNAVLIWTVESHSGQYRRSECVRVINKPVTNIPVPLTDIQFDSSGEYLVACSPQSSKLLVINTAKTPEELTAVGQFWRTLGTCFTRVSWSPDNCKVLCLTTSNNFQIFHKDQNWSSDKLKNSFPGVIQSAVWSRPKGQIVLIAPRNSTEVYALFHHHTVEAKESISSRAFHKVLDLSEVIFDNGVKVGGRVHDMAWDKKSERLAISFKDNRQCIALYKTVIRSNLEITPIGFIHGLIDEIPLLISFHDCFKSGSLFTVCWSSGLISYIPLEFEKNANQSVFANGTPRPLTSFCVSSPSRQKPLLDISRSTPIRTPLRELNESRADTPLFNLATSESALSPRRPILFSTLKNKKDSLE